MVLHCIRGIRRRHDGLCLTFHTSYDAILACCKTQEISSSFPTSIIDGFLTIYPTVYYLPMTKDCHINTNWLYQRYGIQASSQKQININKKICFCASSMHTNKNSRHYQIINKKIWFHEILDSVRIKKPKNVAKVHQMTSVGRKDYKIHDAGGASTLEHFHTATSHKK